MIEVIINQEIIACKRKLLKSRIDKFEQERHKLIVQLGQKLLSISNPPQRPNIIDRIASIILPIVDRVYIPMTIAIAIVNQIETIEYWFNGQ